MPSESCESGCLGWRPFEPKAYFWVSLTIFCLALVAFLGVVAYTLDKPLLGPHSFRQTQTAISTRYMAEEPRLFWDYITPVLGKPWQIPMEVPIFQWIVARGYNFLGFEPGDLGALDRVGRLFSAVAWLVCVVPACGIVRWLGANQSLALLAGAILLSSPLYLFWGCAFLIETTGTLLVCSMVGLMLWGAKRRSWVMLLGAAATSVLCVLCKGTTWVVGASVAGLLVVLGKGFPSGRQWLWCAYGLAAVGVGFVPGKLWVAWADEVKSANPFARELLVISSPHQAAWNYGTWQQKVDGATWEMIFRHVAEGLLVAAPVLGWLFFPAVMVSGLLVRPRAAGAAGLLLLGFAAGPVIFTNLYFEHSYYWVANGVWIILAVGVSVAAISQEPKWGFPVAAAVTGVAVVFGFLNWHQRYRPILDALPSRAELEEAWTRPVQAIVPPQRTLLIVGNDWNPNALYYADRKGIAFPTFEKIPFPGPQLEESLAKLEPEEALGAVVVNPALLEHYGQVFEGFLMERGFSTRGIRTAFGVLFPAEDLVSGSQN